MIHISENGKGLVEIHSWEDIFERQGFVVGINPHQHKLKEIIGRYSIDSKQPCGLSTCQQPHLRGFLVVIEGGQETNIGNKCGKKHFNVDWKEMKDAFTKRVNEQRYRERLHEFKNQVGGVKAGVVVLLANGIENVIQKMHACATKNFEQRTLDALHRRSVKGDAMVFADQLNLSEDDREIARLTGARSNVERQMLFIISGVTSIVKYKKMKSNLVGPLGSDLKGFEEVDPDILTHSELKRWHAWANKVEKLLSETQEILDECNRFIDPDNISRIRQYKGYL